MNRTNLTVTDYYGLATAYRERSHIAVNSDDLEARDYAANLATQAYKDCVNLMLKSPGYGIDTWRDLGPNCEILSSYYYLALLIAERGGGTPPIDLWGRTVMIHASARHYIDFIWTLCLYQIPGLEQHLHIISKVLPEGYHGRFDLTILTEGKTPVDTKDYINSIVLDSTSKKKSANKDSAEPEPRLSSRDPRKLLELANKAIAGLLDCVEEISLYLCTIAKSGANEAELAQGYVQLTDVPCPSMVTGDSTGSQCPPLDESHSHRMNSHNAGLIMGGEALAHPFQSTAPGLQVQSHMGYHPPPGQHGFYDQYGF